MKFVKSFSILIPFFLIHSVSGNPINDLDKIGKANRYKERATEAIENEDFDLAISSYHYLLDSMGGDESEILLNLAHCYYKKGDEEQASRFYQELVSDKENKIKAAANQQLGVMQAKKGELDSALEHLKTALKANPSDEKIRYDYVTVKKMLEDQKKKEKEEEQKKEDQDDKKDEQKEDKQDQKDQQQKQDQQNQEQDQKDQQQQQQDQQQKDQQEQEKQQQNQQEQKEGEDQQQQQEQKEEENKEGEKKDAQQQSAEEKKEEEKKQQQQMQEQRMQQINMTPEKAKMILDALKNQEVQYYQQMRRKAKPKESDKPDW